MELRALREAVCAANIELNARGLITYTWGNVSGIDRGRGLVAIKPSGVDYADLTPDAMVIVNLDGEQVEGDLRPSSDTPTHLALYNAFQIGGVAHTHSVHATMFAQACQPLPCYGTTHADHFYGEIPVTDELTTGEIEADYEANTGDVIIRAFNDRDPLAIPAVLVAQHAPFTWGEDAHAAVRHSVILEEVARMALGTLSLAPSATPVAKALLDKHYLRKHGATAYYGQSQ